MPRFLKISREYCPTGTSSPASAMFFASVIFSKPVTFVSPSFGLIRATLFSRRSTTESFLASSSSTSASICLVAAEKKISHLEPSSICVCNVPELSALKRILTSGYSSLKSFWISSIAFARLAAINTYRSPLASSVVAACTLPALIPAAITPASITVNIFFFMNISPFFSLKCCSIFMLIF